jgi:hypothetical protein
MTKEQIALAKRAVACKGWKWMAGMRTVYIDGGDDYRPGQAFRRTDFLECVEPYQDDTHFHNGSIWYGARDDGLPDLTDPATLGCLLQLVRKAMELDNRHHSGIRWISEKWFDNEGMQHSTGGWRFYWESKIGARSGYIDGLCATEAEALVAALEAAQ